MNAQQPITLSRDCDAIQIPSGQRFTLPAGSEVKIMQSLGGSHTVRTQFGVIARIDAEDADALGISPSETPSIPPVNAPFKPLEERVYDQLRSCYDPEIPANIVDLGLIYNCLVEDAPFGKRVEITMTLTSPGCGIGDILVQDIRTKLQRLREVSEVEIDIVFDPPWDPSRIPEDVRLELGLFG